MQLAGLKCCVQMAGVVSQVSRLYKQCIVSRREYVGRGQKSEEREEKGEQGKDKEEEEGRSGEEKEEERCDQQEAGMK